MPAVKALAQWRIVPDTIIIVLGELPRRTGEQGNDETQQAVRAGFQQQGRQDHAARGGGLRMGVAQPAMQRHDLDAAERLGRVPPGVPAGQVEVSNRDSSRLEPLLVGGDPDGHVWSGSGCRLTSERSGDPYGFTPSASADFAQTGPYGRPSVWTGLVTSASSVEPRFAESRFRLLPPRIAPSAQRKARRSAVHRPAGFSSFSEAQGWAAVFLGRYSVLPGTARLLRLLL